MGVSEHSAVPSHHKYGHCSVIVQKSSNQKLHFRRVKYSLSIKSWVFSKNRIMGEFQLVSNTNQIISSVITLHCSAAKLLPSFRILTLIFTKCLKVFGGFLENASYRLPPKMFGLELNDSTAIGQFAMKFGITLMSRSRQLIIYFIIY